MKSIVANSLRRFVVACVALALPGCGEVDGDATETVRGELGSFGSWSNMGGVVFDGPAIAKTAGTTLTAFAHGTDYRIWTTAQNTSGQWTGNWTQVNWNTFGSRPAAVGIDVPSGPLVNHFLLAAHVNGDGRYWIRIQNQSGSSVPMDWQPLEAPFYTFTSPPALAFVPASPVTDTVPAIFLAGLASEGGGQIVVMHIKLINNNYNHRDWWVANQRVMSAATAPALAYVPPSFKGQSYVVMAAGVASGSNFVYRISWFDGFGGTWPDWSSWQNVPNGLFRSDPALAAGNQGEFGSEVVLFGRGTDSRIWATNSVPNGGFSPIGTATFISNPVAMGYANKVVVSTISGSSVPFSNTANSPF